MDSFISWVGGKKLLRDKIIKEFPPKETFSRYIEVFGGAGWILFAVEKHASREVYNDINGNLVNLFRCVKYHPEEMKRELEFVFMSREQFCDARGQLEMPGLTDIQRAVRFYVLIKESFGSDIHSFGLVPKDMKKAREYLSEIAIRLRRVVIENADFRRIISNYDTEGTLFYLDPPYYKAEKYYTAKFTKEDHVCLKEMLCGIKGKFILSYNDCEYIRKLYKGYNIREVCRGHNLLQESSLYKELIIKNFP